MQKYVAIHNHNEGATLYYFSSDADFCSDDHDHDAFFDKLVKKFNIDFEDGETLDIEDVPEHFYPVV